ncbi:MAG: HlyD family type I secretion periplasmic adaptor subunit [Pseudoalteromonas sp.]|nr:HlyD family type I secretion periplasmic adaptor subunit [Pseudoalteromonas sp.]
MLIIFLMFGVFGVWSAFAPLDSAALAPGTITVKGNRKTVQHLEGGIVKQLYVKDGDIVKSGDPLVRLDDTQARAELQILKGQLYLVQAQEARLVAERDDLESIVFPDALVKAGDARAEDAQKLELQQFSVRRVSYEGEVEVFKQRVGQLQTQAKGLRALIKSKKSLIASYEEEINDNQELLSQGFVDKMRLREMQRSKENLLGEVAEHESSIAGITVQIGEAKLQILQLKKDLRSEVVGQLTEVQANLFDVRERIAAVEDRVNRALITAPVEGVVLGLSFHTVGGVVSPGKPILDIVPEGEELVIDAQVAPIDIDRVYVGLEADVRFSAFKSAVTPVVKGKVITLSADSLQNEDGSSYYAAKVELTAEGREMLGEDLVLVPGMPAEVLINTGARTLLEYLIQPATNAFARSMIED